MYEYYLHLRRLKLIRVINKQKKYSLVECARCDAELYKSKIGHQLDWGNLKTYTEKMQWEKMFDDNPLKIQLADKYLVRAWIEEKIGAEYLIPLLGVWESFDEIDFNSLPRQFVLKTNNGSGTNIIVRDKKSLNLKQVRRKIQVCYFKQE